LKALVVFSGESAHPLARLLKPGFHHCFAVVLSDENWIKADWKTGVPEVRYVTRDFDLAAFYREQGFTVIETEQGDRPTWSPITLNNCVGFVKSALCIRSWAATPWGLYRHLKRKAQ
tara:strand:+ start:239 stop:589 length:351 start_codon:yes stop_codon:yes gene_type:complete